MIDRSKLADLYPSVSKRTDNLSYKPIKRLVAISDTKLTFLPILSIATLLTVTIVASVLLNDFIRVNISASSGSYITVSVIAMSMALWLGLFVAVAIGVSKLLFKLGVNWVLFAFIYGLCALPIFQFIYNSYTSLNDGTVFVLPLSAMLFIENLVFVYLILAIITTKKISDRIKSGILVFAVILCAAVTVVNSFYR